MNPTIFFSVCSLLYSVLLIINLFSRKEKNNIETKILKVLAIVNFISLGLEAGGIFLGNNYEKLKLLNDIALKGMLVFYIMWFTTFLIYVFNISRESKNFSLKKDKYVYLCSVIAIILVLVLPITYVTNEQNVIIYSTGAAVDVLRYFTVLSEAVGLFVVFSNAKKVKVFKYSSLFILIVLTTLSATIQTQYPSLLLVASVQTFVMYIEYINIKKRQLLEKEEVKK